MLVQMEQRPNTPPKNAPAAGPKQMAPTATGTIDKVISLDCEKIAKEMFGKFVSRLDGDKQNE